MRRVGKVCLAVLFILLISQTTVLAEEIMPLSEVEPGMEGVGKTVVRGTEIEEFDVEIASILSNPEGISQPLILIEVSGDLIEKTGGIASGMSGSPIYIDDKLIGAIGYGWEMTEHKIGMVTPIESMLELLEMGEEPKPDLEEETLTLDRSIEVDGTEYTQLQLAKKGEEVVDSQTLKAKPVETPLMVSGLSGRAKTRLKEDLEDYDLQPVQAGSAPALEETPELKPGSAAAAQLVRGDVEVSAVGTLTYRDGDQVLAFGHPLMSLGPTNYFLSSAYIHRMIPSVQMPFKLGSPIEIEGILDQDRTAAVSGKVGTYPNVIPVEVMINDQDLGLEDRAEFQVVKNEDLLQELIPASILQTIDSAIDRMGGGTAEVKLEIMGSDLPGEVLERKNLYYSDNDIAAASLIDLLQALDLVLFNPFREVNIVGIQFDVEIKDEIKLALVEDIELDKEEVKPGEEITADVYLRPYREDLITKEVSFTIPEEVEEGPLVIEALSGQEATLDQMMLDPSEEESPTQTDRVQDLHELVEIFEERYQNNQLLVEAVPAYGGANMQEEDREEIESREIDREVMELDYVLQGRAGEELEVLSLDEKDQTEEEEEQEDKRE